jgi:hypothetical protein
VNPSARLPITMPNGENDQKFTPAQLVLVMFSLVLVLVMFSLVACPSLFMLSQVSAQVAGHSSV